MAEILLRAEEVPADLGWAFEPVGGEPRDVFTIATEPTPFAHFATFPRALVRRMILAGTSERGCCPECGAPWVRETEISVEGTRHISPKDENPDRNDSPSRSGGTSRLHSQYFDYQRREIGWSPSCACTDTGAEQERFLTPAPVPCTVLDPFAGSGTTCLVARQHGRRSVGIELNADYCQLAADRLAQQSLLTELA